MKLFWLMPRRLKMVTFGDQAFSCRPGICCVIWVVSVIPSARICWPLKAVIEMPTF